MRLLNRATFNMNDAAIAVSQDVADSMVWPSRDIQVVDNGIDIHSLENVPDERQAILSEFGLPENSFLIGKVANMVHSVVPEPRATIRGLLGPRIEGHTKVESTVRYLGVEVDDALDIAEQIEI